MGTNLDVWIAGAVAAVTVDFIVYPFDTLKTRIQSPDYNRIYKDASTGAIRKNVLFRGAFFTTYESVKRLLGDTPSSSSTSTSTSTSKRPFTLPTPLIHGLASSTAEMVSCAILTPAEVIKQNAQVINISPSPSSSSSDMSAKTKSATAQVLAKFRNQPWKLWSGYTALVGRNLPATGLNFPILEFVKGWLVSWREAVVVARRRVRHGEQGSQEGGAGAKEGRRFNPIVETALLTGLAASVSGTISSIVTTPIDVVKTRMMLSATSPPSDGKGEDSIGKQAGIQARKKEKLKKAARRGTIAMGRQIWTQEGLKGLFRGGAVRSVWTALGMSIYLGFYEGGRLYLEDRRARREEDEGAAL
ncbi:putative mitochondrial carrier protein [Aspergillus candidus]|uniref:Mitochondrial carrier domain-containing protein n=1 Tax=Aspergillus candidus TaxID=41067 RepID=A0A2I2FHB5_ASPCN|nr:mitochondrial carrier domain-containing protein [Aspergillus candidus]PLB40025.1 mitochondrial carrier domain-containing protein [Aspergillus candidus]